MFVPFLYELRKRKVPVGPQEAMALATALQHGLHESSLDGFYYVARSVLVHREGHLDAFDEAFASYFRGIQAKSLKVKQELYEWLKDAKERHRELSPEERELLQQFDLEELRRMFEERMNEQDEQHDGGNHWIGSEGESKFGRKGGRGGGGVRVGGKGGMRSAVQVADARQYRSYRSDVTLDVRQMGMALRRLRQFVREGVEDELDLDGTIRETANNAGELEVVLRAPRKPNTKVILMMDVGGSMDPYTQLMSRLFSATKKATHFKELRTYYFHNCVYGRVYATERFDEPIFVRDLLHECGPEYKLIMVGDALMAPYELMQQGGSLSYNDRNQLPGIAWLTMLQDHFRKAIWLNPEPPNYWMGSTIETIGRVIDMFPLTLDGLTEAMAFLNRGRAGARARVR